MTGIPFNLQVLIWGCHIGGSERWELTAALAETRSRPDWARFHHSRNGAPAWDDDLGIAGYTGYAEREMSRERSA